MNDTSKKLVEVARGLKVYNNANRTTIAFDQLCDEMPDGRGGVDGVYFWGAVDSDWVRQDGVEHKIDTMLITNKKALSKLIKAELAIVYEVPEDGQRIIALMKRQY